MDLYIFRHAWAADRDNARWPDDALRPLTAEGRERFAQLVAKLNERGMAPGIIAASPLVRCIETAEILAAGMAERPEIVELDSLQPGSDLGALWRWTTQKARRHEQIAWVGHMPDVCLLTAALIGGGDATLHFAKGGAAAIRFDGPLEPAAGELRWLVSAKVLGC